MDASGRSQDPRRAGARIRDTAEGVLIALRGYTLNQAFVEIVQTAKAHNVSTRSLADALVAWPKTRRPGTATTPRSWPPALRGGTLSTGAGRAAACDVTTKTTLLRRLEPGGVEVAVVVGHRHDNGLIDHI